MKTFLLMIFALIAAASLPARADERASDVEAFMEEYLRLWNAGDAGTITEKAYRFDAPNPFASKAGLQAEFDRLKKAGYSHSQSTSIEACWINATQALVELRYTRIKRDGTAMPPNERSTLYFVKKSADGLRINHLIPMNATTRWDCASYKLP
jgi:ketosteroid isomerase-like protein